MARNRRLRIIISIGMIKTSSGRVVLKNGKASCVCCGSCNLEWITTYSGQNNGNPWTVSNNGSGLRIDLEDSENCGGSNENVQSGTAIATITVVGSNVELGFAFSGIAEMQDSGFENISFYLDDERVASATSPGGNLGCEMGPSVVTYWVNPPYILEAGTHTFLVDFSSGDSLFHVGSYYAAEFTCQAIAP